MEENEYKSELKKALAKNSINVKNKLNSALNAIPEKAKSIEIMILPDQDGEGAFGVQLLLGGPDSYVLNKAIEEYAELIEVRHTPQGLEPNVPMVDPFDTSFQVNDVLCDTVADWLVSIWDELEPLKVNLPVSIVADEGVGTSLPIKLS